MQRPLPPAAVVGIVALGLLALLALVMAKPLGLDLPPVVASLLWFLVPLTGASIVAGTDVLKELGLTRFHSRGVAVVLLGSLAMGVGMALGGEEAVFDAGLMWRKAARAGLVEEIGFRGFAFGLLFWRARWSFVAAMGVTGAAFGAFHLPMAVLGGHLDQAWGAALLTGAGGCWFAWLYARWDRSLWVPIAAHVGMNFWWTLYTAGPTAAGGGSGAMWGRVATITLVTVATSRMTPPLGRDRG